MGSDDGFWADKHIACGWQDAARTGNALLASLAVCDYLIDINQGTCD